MRYARLIVFAACAVLVSMPAFAQQGKLVVESTTPKELKRTARRMRIPVEQLKNLRTMLQEATDLTLRLNSVQPMQVGNLGGLWIQFHRTKAASAIESIYADMKSDAQKADDGQSYQQLTSAAQVLLSSLAELDSERAIQLMRQWPSPPASLGPNAEKMRNSFEETFKAQVIQKLSFRDPAQAMALRSEWGVTTATDYTARARLAQQLMSSGKKDDALKLVDEAIAGFRQQTANRQSYSDYMQFVMQLPPVDTDRFLAALNQLAQAPPDAAPPVAPTYRIGDQTVQTTYWEYQMMNGLRALQSRPELLLKTLYSMPDLKAKVDQLGGIDNFLNPGRSGMSMIMVAAPNAAGVMPSGGIVSSVMPSSFLDPSSLYQQLRGKAEKNPLLVRQKLSEAFPSPDRAESLINLAQMASYEDPELSSLALDTTRQLLPREHSLFRRAAIMQNLVRAYRNCEGEVDPEVLREGFILADEIRQQQKQNASNQERPSIGSPADELESLLVAEYAHDNFEAARRYLQSLPDDNLKLMIFIRTVQSLAQQ